MYEIDVKITDVHDVVIAGLAGLNYKAFKMSIKICNDAVVWTFKDVTFCASAWTFDLLPDSSAATGERESVGKIETVKVKNSYLWDCYPEIKEAAMVHLGLEQEAQKVEVVATASDDATIFLTERECVLLEQELHAYSRQLAIDKALALRDEKAFMQLTSDK